MTNKENVNRIVAISRCLDRYESLCGVFKDRISAFIDLDRSNIDAEMLSMMKDEDVIHDINGIMNNFNRTTGTIDNFFVPRAGTINTKEK